MARVFCVQDGTGKQLSFDGACLEGWKPLTTAKPAAGGTVTPTPSTSTGKSIDPMAYFPKLMSEVNVNTATPQGIMQASNPLGSPTWNKQAPQAEVLIRWDLLPYDQQQQIDRIAKAIDYRGTGRSMWERATRASSLTVAGGTPRTPYDLINQFAVEAGVTADGGGGSGSGGGGGGGGAAAPVAADPSSMKRLMDQLSLDMLGRTLSDKEFKSYYGKYKGAFSGNPAIDAQQHGMEALQRNNDYQEFQVASKFATAMKSVMEGAA